MADEVNDILLEAGTGKPLFNNGDLVVGISDPQHIDHLLRAAPGQYYQFPKIGINIKQYTLDSNNRQEIQQGVRIGLEADNFNVRDVIIEEASKDSFSVDINAIRKK
jgi:hypothetical protein